MLELSAAGRFEHYSDFGSTETGKISGRFEPIKGYALRATASTGFRAPSLQQEHYGSSSTIGVLLPGATATVLYPVQLLPPDSTPAKALGAKPLEPEKSTNYSVGLVAQPITGLNITLDLYQIDIKGRILQIAQLGPSTAISNILAAAGLNPNQAAFFYTNAGDTRTRGTDLVIDYRRDFGDLGSFKWTLSANLNKGKFTRLIPPAFGVTLITRAAQGNFTDAQPKDKEIFSTDYSRGKFSANLRITRYGKLKTIAATAALDDTVAAAGLVDVDLGYQINDHVKLDIGANNLTNYMPDLVQPNNRGGANPFSYYNQTAPYGIAGGFYYVKANFTF